MGAHSQTESTCLHDGQRARALAAWLLVDNGRDAAQFRDDLGIVGTIANPNDAVMRRALGRLFEPEVSPDRLEAAMRASRRR